MLPILRVKGFYFWSEHTLNEGGWESSLGRTHPNPLPSAGSGLHCSGLVYHVETLPIQVPIHHGDYEEWPRNRFAEQNQAESQARLGSEIPAQYSQAKNLPKSWVEIPHPLRWSIRPWAKTGSTCSSGLMGENFLSSVPSSNQPRTFLLVLQKKRCTVGCIWTGPRTF